MKTNSKNTVAIIVPLFNEQKVINGVLRSLLKEVVLLGADILVVNDGSTDQTLKHLKKFKEDIEIISYEKNRGKGFAMRQGADFAHKRGYQTIVFFDGDGQFITSDLKKVIGRLGDDCDLAVGRRWLNFVHLFTSKIGRLMVRRIFNLFFSAELTDQLSGFRAMKSWVYPIVRWKVNDYRVEIEMLARASLNDIKVKEIPVNCRKKLYRGITWQDGVKIFAWMAVNLFRRRNLQTDGRKWQAKTKEREVPPSVLARELYLKRLSSLGGEKQSLIKEEGYGKNKVRVKQVL